MLLTASESQAVVGVSPVAGGGRRCDTDCAKSKEILVSIGRRMNGKEQGPLRRLPLDCPQARDERFPAVNEGAGQLIKLHEKLARLEVSSDKLVDERAALRTEVTKHATSCKL